MILSLPDTVASARASRSRGATCIAARPRAWPPAAPRGARRPAPRLASLRSRGAAARRRRRTRRGAGGAAATPPRRRGPARHLLCARLLCERERREARASEWRRRVEDRTPGADRPRPAPRSSPNICARGRRPGGSPRRRVHSRRLRSARPSARRGPGAPAPACVVDGVTRSPDARRRRSRRRSNAAADRTAAPRGSRGGAGRGRAAAGATPARRP